MAFEMQEKRRFRQTIAVLALLVAGIGLFVVDSARGEEKGKAVDLAARALGVPMSTKHEHTPEHAALAREIGQEVVCLCGTCPKRTISDCECGWAKQHQNSLVNAVVAGNSKERIIQTYRQVYGDQVLAMLPNEGFAITAWALPYAVAMVAFVVILLLGIRFAAKPSTVTAMTEQAEDNIVPAVTDDDEAREQLERELEDLD